ncbi:hypothetical protein KAU45_07930 [bacterium]|nr:hypothetical protein [bacterium]
MAQRGSLLFPVCSLNENHDMCRLSDDDGETRTNSEDEWGTVYDCFFGLESLPLPRRGGDRLGRHQGRVLNRSVADKTKPPVFERGVRKSTKNCPLHRLFSCVIYTVLLILYTERVPTNSKAAVNDGVDIPTVV